MQGTTLEGHRTVEGQDFIDPVCGMHVAESSPHRRRIEGVEYRFCSAHCLERLVANPAVFLKEDARR